MRHPVHRGLAAFLAERNFVAEGRPDGAVVLLSDGRHRVFIHPAPQGEVALEVQVVELATDARRADEMLEQALAFAGDRLTQGRESIVLTPNERQLQLQWRVGADEDANAVADAMEKFLNALAAWRQEMGEP